MIIITLMLRVILQVSLLFIMLFCIFCFAASFEYSSINRYQIIYSVLLALMSILFIKLATNKTHQHISYYMVLLTALMWIFVVLHEIVNFLMYR